MLTRLRWFSLLLWVTASSQAEEVWNKHVVAEGFANQTAVAADYNGDGKKDVITSAGGKVLLFLAPDWKRTELYAIQGGGNAIHSATFDVDRDGRPDYVGARYQPGFIFWLRCPEKVEERWEFRLIDKRANGVHGIDLGDIDADGVLDIAAGSAQPRGEFPESLVWIKTPKAPLKAKSWQTFSFARRDAPGLSHYVGIGDINGDGRPDCASAAKGGPSAPANTGDWFAWWEAPKDPEQAWKKHLISREHPGATNILVADVNRDGKPDLVASRGHGRGVLWFEAPQWKPHMIHPTLEGPHCLAIGDVDGDGDVDVATCAKDDKLAVWFENDGKGGFQTHVCGTNQAAYDIRLVDMDSDKDLDMLIAGQASRNVVWYENPR